MMFSIVMQSYIDNEERIQKLHRAINSVLGQQTKCSFELIIVADGCQTTFDEVKKNYLEEFKSQHPRIRLFQTENNHKHNGKVYSTARNIALERVCGEYVLYLDNDDYFANDYLQRLCKKINGTFDWYLVDDMIWNNKQFIERRCNLKPSLCGTSNIIHRSEMKSRWPAVASYGKDDYTFILNLLHESKNYYHMNIAGYCCCHIPKRYDI